MFDPRIELLLKHHPASIFYRQPTGHEYLEQLERRPRPLPDFPDLLDHDDRARSLLDIFALAFAALVLVGVVALVATGEVEPPATVIVADLPPGER